jgi:hypothetical protein
MLQDETIDLGSLYDHDDERLLEARELMQEELYFFIASNNWPLQRSAGEPVPLAEIAALDLAPPSGATACAARSRSSRSRTASR